MSGLRGNVSIAKISYTGHDCLLCTYELSVSDLPLTLGAFSPAWIAWEGGKSATGLIRHGFPNELD